MSRDELLKILKTLKENNAEKYEITALGLFCSAVRDENKK